MLFSSLAFFIFWPISFLLWRLTPSSQRLWLIIFASLIFYGYWNYYYTFLPIFLTLIGFLTIRAVQNYPQKQKAIITIGLILLISPLLYFKYSNFIFSRIITEYDLPLGISFITFTLIAYIIDVIKGEYKNPEGMKNLSAYILFFPQLIAGPILRPKELLPQLKKSISWVDLNILLGVFIFCIGLFKKVIIADTLAIFVDPVYLSPSQASFNEFIFAFYGFSAQIYFDFSGYTDMAIGVALVFGINLPINFNSPYSSHSIQEFWRRWHMTLSRWFRDYVYIPLGGNRDGNFRTAINLIITMTLCGIWHGAGWNFLIWGFAHGLLVLFSRNSLPSHNNFKNLLKISFTFHLVTLLWVFFRANDFNHAFEIFNLFFNSSPVFNLFEIVIFISLLVMFFLTHKYDKFDYFLALEKRLKTPTKLLFIGVSFILCVLFTNGSSGEFIYFDF